MKKTVGILIISAVALAPAARAASPGISSGDMIIVTADVPASVLLQVVDGQIDCGSLSGGAPGVAATATCADGVNSNPVATIYIVANASWSLTIQDNHTGAPHNQCTLTHQEVGRTGEFVVHIGAYDGSGNPVTGGAATDQFDVTIKGEAITGLSNLDESGAYSGSFTVTASLN